MTVVGTDVIVDERKVDDTGNLPEKVVLGDGVLQVTCSRKAWVGVRDDPSRCITSSSAFYGVTSYINRKNPLLC